MPSKPESAQWKQEARRIEKADRIVGESDFLGKSVPRNERIETQPREAYEPPPFLRQTATPDEQAQLREILNELWRLNDQFAGDRTTEIEVFLAATDEVGVLSELARDWCEGYFGNRIRKVSPRDSGDPMKTFDRLCKEYDAILGHLALAEREKCIDYVPLQQCTLYVRWLLGNATIESLRKDRSRGACNKLDWFCNYLNQLVPLRDFLSRFVQEVSAFADQERLSQLSQYTETSLKQNLRDLACDVQEMRPFLVRGFDFAKSVVSTDNNSVCLAWDWTTKFGIANILSAPTKESLVEHYTASHSVSVPIVVGHDGVLLDGMKPWVTAATMPSMPGINPLAVSQYILEMFCDKLYSFYDKIDFSRIEQHTKEAAATGIVSDDEDKVWAQSCIQLAATECEEDESAATLAPEEQSRLPRHRSVRMMQLLNMLKRSFGCEVEYGKGSEITVFRRGGKKARLGHHERNGIVPAVKVKWLVGRLGIPLRDWLLAINE